MNAMESFNFVCNTTAQTNEFIVSNALPDRIADQLLIDGQCHVDHEGFDLNEIELAYYKANGILLSYDNTWYKDGGQTAGTNSVLEPWCMQTSPIENLIIDHSHFVFKFPITGAARTQILKYIPRRAELLRLLSVNFKCGLDLCIDYLNHAKQSVEPIVHIEWDFDNIQELVLCADKVQAILNEKEWLHSIDSILRFNQLARKNKIDAFAQADTRSMIIFGEKSYKLIPTL